MSRDTGYLYCNADERGRYTDLPVESERFHQRYRATCVHLYAGQRGCCNLHADVECHLCQRQPCHLKCGYHECEPGAACLHCHLYRHQSFLPGKPGSLYLLRYQRRNCSGLFVENRRGPGRDRRAIAGLDSCRRGGRHLRTNFHRFV